MIKTQMDLDYAKQTEKIYYVIAFGGLGITIAGR